MLSKYFYMWFFPFLFIFPTVNILAFIGIPIPQITFTNIAIIIFIIFSFGYRKIDKKSILLLSFFIFIVTFSLLISSLSLSSTALIRAFISVLYYIFILFIFYAVMKTFLYLKEHNKEYYIRLMLRNIGIYALFFFYLITIYHTLFAASPELLSSDPTLGYRDYGHPIINGITDYNKFRALGSFPEPSMYAGFIVTILPMMFMKNKYYNITILLLVIYSVLLTYSRIGILLLIIYGLIYFLMSNKKTKFIMFFLLISLILLIADVILYNGGYIVKNIVRMYSMFEYMDVSILTRVMTPFIFFGSTDEQLFVGYGIGSLIDLFPKLDLDESYLQFSVPTLNNFYLNFLAEFGVIFFIIFIGLLLSFLYKLVKYNIHKSNPQEFVSFFLIMSYFFQIGHLTMFYMYFLFIAIFFYLFFHLLKREKHAIK